MATTSPTRPWEVDSPAKPYNATPKGQLPSISSLTGTLPDRTSGLSHLSSPNSLRERDSGAWSSQPHSTRMSITSTPNHDLELMLGSGSSTYSTNTSSYTFPSNTNSYYMAQNRGSNFSNSSHFGSLSQPSTDYTIPTSNTSAHTSPGFSANNNVLPSINQAKEPTRDSKDFPPQESRRSSIGSSVGQGMNSLAINGSSIYNNHSTNPSSTSLSQNLSRERGIQSLSSPTNGLRTSRSSAQLPNAPLSPHLEHRPAMSRVAPPIGRNPRSEVYNADEPIPGQAYAFPDAPYSQPGALPPKSSHGSRTNVSKIEEDLDMFSRRDSGRQSVASSIHTVDSRLPPGQRHFEDGINNTHHHSMQSDQMRRISGTDSMTPEADGAQPYSRTPALRVSHKMAERKRRSEMKDLFENLRSQIPTNQGSKSSKWEILTKASEYIKQLEHSSHVPSNSDQQLRLAFSDLDMTRRDNDGLRGENQRLMQELAMMRQQQQPPLTNGHPTPPQQHHQSNQGYAAPQHYVPPPPPPPPAMNDPGRNLPPLSNGASNNGASSSSSAMQGIQYTHEHR